MSDSLVLERCACGEPATANGRECPDHFRERLGSVQQGFAPTRTLGAGQMDRTASKRMESRLEDYRKVRYEGIQPLSTRQRHIDQAKELSDLTGSAHRADRAAREAAGVT